MEPNTQFVDKWLADSLSKLGPTGFSAGQTIKYGVLSSGFLEARDGPKVSDYALGASDPAYVQALADWTEKRGKNFTPVSEAQMAMIDKAFAALGKVLGVTFQRDDTNAQIRFGTGDLAGMTAADGVTDIGGYNVRKYFGDTSRDYNVIVMPKSSDMNGDGQEWAPGSGYFVTLMHEIEHALGLDHPGSYLAGQEVFAGKEDNRLDTIMSYRKIRPYTDDRAGYGSVLQDTAASSQTITPERYDIFALQRLLGVNLETSGDNTRFSNFKQTTLTERAEYQTIFDAGGTGDVIDASNITAPVEINLEPGTASSIGTPSRNVVIAFNTIIENAIGGSGNDIIIGNDFANELDGRGGKDTLKGGKGEDTYVIGDGADIIFDSEGDGKIVVGAQKFQLTGSATEQRKTKKGWSGWADSNDKSYVYKLASGSLSEGGTLEIYKDYVLIGTVENFKNSTLGINLKDQLKTSIQKQASANPFGIENADPSPPSNPINLAENLGQGLKVFLNSAAKAGDTITLALSALGEKFKAVLGDDVVGFDSGNITLTLAEGQTEIAFGFLSTGDVDVDQQLTLTATLQPADGGDAVDSTLTINFDAVDESQSPTTSATITGDIIPADTDTSKEGIQAAGDAYGNPLGEAGAYGDILFGSAGNDWILPGDLDDDVNGLGGDDWISGGSGRDFINGADGNDLLEGEAGSDILSGDAGDDKLYSDNRIDTAVAIENGNTQSGSGQKGSWLSGNEGNDTLVSGADNDVLAGGAGQDVLVAGAGDDNILGDANYTVQQLWDSQWLYNLNNTNWYHSNEQTYGWGYTDEGNTRVFSPVEGEVEPAGGAADLIHAGNSNDRVWAGAGDDLVFGEGGNDNLIGESGNDNLLAGC
ncbi:M10 family metallopeptidase C-terminal domain-containing protein [Dechloromonas sp. ARDL1]|uniref:M10 family metallopeptidase C-terminal domain-containing protein n=1 Tax=Dechloromonas sp. ARDL1 TaxID=3322121 RepID=UPI003DA75D3E